MQISGYHVNNIIGQGGMATVYRAEHILLKQERALKVMSPELTNQPGFKDSFIRESQIVAALKHPNIITIYNVEECDGLYFMAMEYLQGGNLAERLSTSSLSLANAVQVLTQIGGALHYAHQQHLIHRDIKPANILFNTEGDAILTDFGISKLQDTESDLTQKGYGLIGTPRYMSPEQTGGQVLDQRSDLYSLALVFYEMLSGERAIKANSTAAIIREHAVTPPPELPVTFAFLQPVLNKALAKTADERYTDIPAFLNAVKLAQKQLKGDKTFIMEKDVPTKRVQPDKPKATRRSPLLYRSLFLFLVLGSIAGVEWWKENHSQQSSTLQQQQIDAPDIALLKTEATTKDKTEKIEPIAQVNTEKIGTIALTNQAKIKKTKPETQTAESPPIIVKSKPVAKTVRARPYTALYGEMGTKRLGQLKQGVTLKVIATTTASDGEEWSKIEFEGRQGYVKSSHLK